MPTVPVKKALSAGFPDVTGGGIDPGDVVCANGIMNIPGAVMYLTANGGAIVHTDSGTPADETDDQIIFGLGQKAITNASDSDGGGTGNMICMVDTNAVGSGKKIVSCVGQSSGDVNQMFNVLFVSK